MKTIRDLVSLKLLEYSASPHGVFSLFFLLLFCLHSSTTICIIISIEILDGASMRDLIRNFPYMTPITNYQLPTPDKDKCTPPLLRSPTITVKASTGSHAIFLTE